MILDLTVVLHHGCGSFATLQGNIALSVNVVLLSPLIVSLLQVLHPL